MGAYTVKPLTPALADDYLGFFDHERGAAFTDNPEWAKCYCHYYEVPKSIDWSTFKGPDNRVAMRSRIEVGEMEGFLAYDDDRVVGWVNAQPRHKLPHCFGRLGIDAPAIECAPHEAAVVVCFVVAPEHRRQGVARALLAGAVASLQQRGVALIDGFPFKTEADACDATDHYHGPLSLFLEQGFTVLDQTDKLTVVRKTLR
jgi:GNAT superfamily N-acetyltransferase